MGYRIDELRNKEVINITDACSLGSVYDVEVDNKDGKVVAIVVVETGGSMFSKRNEYVIAWNEIERIGDDVILVCHDIRDDIARQEQKRLKTKNFFR